MSKIWNRSETKIHKSSKTFRKTLNTYIAYLAEWNIYLVLATTPMYIMDH